MVLAAIVTIIVCCGILQSNCQLIMSNALLALGGLFAHRHCIYCLIQGRHSVLYYYLFILLHEKEEEVHTKNTKNLIDRIVLNALEIYIYCFFTFQ